MRARARGHPEADPAGAGRGRQGPSALLAAALWMGLTIASFLLMAVAVRALAGRIPLVQILTVRSAVGLLLLSPFLWLAVRRGEGLYRADRLADGGPDGPRPGPRRLLAMHVVRNVIHFAGQYGWTLGVTLLPLAQVFAFEFSVPIWVALLAVLFLGERLSLLRAAATVIGFAGVLVALAPDLAPHLRGGGGGGELPGALAVLGAAVCFGGSVVLVKVLSRYHSALAIVYLMSLLQLPLGLVLALPVWTGADPGEWGWMVVVGLCGLGAHYAMARALAVADASVVMPLDFARLPLAALLGLLLYGERPGVATFLGGAIIFGASWLLIRGERASARALAPDPGS